MSDLMLSQPPHDDDSEDRQEHGAGAQRRQREGGGGDKPKIMSEEKCLEMLSQLPGLVTMGFIKPQAANLIKGVCTTVLQHYQKTQAAREQPSLASEELGAVLREKPELASMLEPLLSEQQIDMLMRDAAENKDHGQA